MTPKEKAQQLLDKMQNEILFNAVNIISKQCALIAVEEVMSYMTPQTDSKEAFDYWREVKQEIENL